jgi:hypothetical protein
VIGATRSRAEPFEQDCTLPFEESKPVSSKSRRSNNRKNHTR